MILLDANLLLYAVNADAIHHHSAKAWLQKTITDGESVALSWTVVLAFLRVSTRPGLFANPLRVEDALEVMNEWLTQENVVIIHPGPMHWKMLGELLGRVGTAGNLTSDAHLAALAIEHEATLCSTDSDFARFPGLNWKNPLL